MDKVQDGEGRLSFRAKFSRKPGVALRATAGAARKADESQKPGIVVEVIPGKAKAGDQLVLRLDSKESSTVTLNGPPGGWHEITLVWKEGKLSMALDGQTAPETLAVSTMHIVSGPGPTSLRPARFLFGAATRSAILAIDDLAAWRSAD